MFGSLPPSIIDAITTLTGLDSRDIVTAYEEWVEQELKEVKLPPGEFDKRILDREDFRGWKAAVCHLNGMPDTTVAFCKLFKMHPYVIDKWISGKLKSAPLGLIQRLAHMRGII